MKLKNKLYIGFGSIILAIIVLNIFMLSRLTVLKDNMVDIVENDYTKVRLSTTVRTEIFNHNSYIRDANIYSESTNWEDTENKLEQAKSRAFQTLTDLERLSNKEDKELIRNFISEFNNYINLSKVLLPEFKKGNKLDRKLSLKAKSTRSQMMDHLEELIEYQENKMSATLNRSNNIYQSTLQFLYYSWFLGVILISLSTFYFIRGFNQRISSVTSAIDSKSEMTLANIPRIENIIDDEIGQISVAYNNLAAALEEQANIEKETRKAIENDSWIKSKLAEFTTMYQGVRDIKSLAEFFIINAAPLLGAQYGAFYYLEEENNNSRLKALASYGFNSSEIEAKEFALGQGLVGQCALENRRILLENIPSDYIRIETGLGEAKPNIILLQPIAFEGRTIAVIELALLNMASDLEVDLLEKIAENTGITLHSISYHMMIEKLLTEAQILTEELQVQQEELQVQQEELRTINEKLEDQYKKEEQKTRELESTKKDLERNNFQLEQSSKFKSEFLANMSHELRTPLNSLLILSQMLAKNEQGNLTHEQVGWANIINFSGSELLALINDILDLSRIESGKVQLHIGEFSIKELTSFIEWQFMPIANGKNVDFEILTNPELPSFIYTDEHRLKQIIKNMLSNAFKFTDAGQVTLKIEPTLQLNEENRDEFIAISVFDTGIGIPEEKQKLIFEAFRQVDGTTSRKYGGSGLGLAISKELAYLLGGYITLESKEGQGSKFTLYLPVHCEEVNELMETNSVESIPVSEKSNQSPVVYLEGSNVSKGKIGDEGCLDGYRVLLVDDDMRNIFALTAYLENQNMIVYQAENGKEALRVLDENTEIDIILMDIMMPEMDGYEAMGKIRLHPVYNKVPIIALTAKAMKNDREKCIVAGASDYISKPVKIEQLMSLMKVWLYKQEEIETENETEI